VTLFVGEFTGLSTVNSPKNVVKSGHGPAIWAHWYNFGRLLLPLHAFALLAVLDRTAREVAKESGVDLRQAAR
jgi:hypothetical protein